MEDSEKAPQPANPAAPEQISDRPPERMVRHVFWKYPPLSMALLVVVAVLAAVVGSPNWPRDTIAGVSTANPGGAVLAFTQELAGTSSSAANAQEYGMGDPAQVFVLGPLRAAAPLLGPIALPDLPTLPASAVQRALAAYDAASPNQQKDCASNYEKALGAITPAAGGAMNEEMPSPDYTKIGTLSGDFGSVPVLVEADLKLAQSGYLEQYLQSVDPGHSFHLTNIWLYDHPNMLNTAVNLGLTDDQWGMVKERGFPVGPWYLAIPAVFHVYFPGGATGQGFVLWNLLFAAVLLFVVPLVPGIRDIPRHLKLYRFIYRYPTPGELEKVAFRERHGTSHGGAEGAGGGE
jgi:hypothetical protein